MVDLNAITVKQWGRLVVRSVVLGIAFFGADLLLALLHGQANPFHFPGGLLGLPLTFLICPGGTIICLVGLVRASYISRRVDGHPPTEQSARS
jgi:integral membrane sensor domain MASE1